MQCKDSWYQQMKQLRMLNNKYFSVIILPPPKASQFPLYNLNSKVAFQPPEILMCAIYGCSAVVTATSGTLPVFAENHSDYLPVLMNIRSLFKLFVTL